MDNIPINQHLRNMSIKPQPPWFSDPCLWPLQIPSSYWDPIHGALIVFIRIRSTGLLEKMSMIPKNSKMEVSTQL